MLRDQIRTLLSHPEQVTDAQLAALDALLTDWRGDTGVMDGLYAALGGAGTAEVFNTLGDLAAARGSSGTIQTLAAHLRDGLVASSVDWDDTRARTFATELLGSPRASEAICYLFGAWETAPMSLPLVSAMADLVDAYEREHGGADWPMGASGTGGALYLAAALHRDTPGWQADPGGAVMGSLAQYPDAAFAWLTDTTCGDDRVVYWFGTRGGAPISDGFAGVGALWESTSHITGGVQDPATADLDRLQAWADLNTRIFQAIAGNESYRPQTISPAGGAYVAAAIGNLLTLLSDVPLSSNAEEYDFTSPTASPVSSELFGWVPVPSLTLEGLGRVLGIALTQPAGIVAFDSTVLRVTQTLVGAIDVTSPDHLEQSEDVMRMVAAMLGLADGARAGVGVGQDVQEALTTQQFWDAATAAGSLATGLAELPDAVQRALDTVSTTQDAATLVGAPSLPGPQDPIDALRDSLHATIAAEQDRETQARTALDQVAQQIAERRAATTGLAIPEDDLHDMTNDATSSYSKAAGETTWTTFREELS